MCYKPKVKLRDKGNVNGKSRIAEQKSFSSCSGIFAYLHNRFNTRGYTVVATCTCIRVDVHVYMYMYMYGGNSALNNSLSLWTTMFH